MYVTFANHQRQIMTTVARTRVKMLARALTMETTHLHALVLTAILATSAKKVPNLCRNGFIKSVPPPLYFVSLSGIL